MVQLLLHGMKPARFRDAVKKQLVWKDGGSDSPSKLVVIMDAQLDKFEAAENVSVMRCRINRRRRDRAKTLDK